MPATTDLERGRVVTAIGILRTRPTEPWTLNALADEVVALTRDFADGAEFENSLRRSRARIIKHPLRLNVSQEAAVLAESLGARVVP